LVPTDDTIPLKTLLLLLYLKLAELKLLFIPLPPILTGMDAIVLFSVA
jgi:hypothetical protein